MKREGTAGAALLLLFCPGVELALFNLSHILNEMKAGVSRDFDVHCVRETDADARHFVRCPSGNHTYTTARIPDLESVSRRHVRAAQFSPADYVLRIFPSARPQIFPPWAQRAATLPSSQLERTNERC